MLTEKQVELAQRRAKQRVYFETQDKLRAAGIRSLLKPNGQLVINEADRERARAVLDITAPVIEHTELTLQDVLDEVLDDLSNPE